MEAPSTGGGGRYAAPAMKVVCPNCRAPIPGDTINVASMSAVCRACAEVFPIAAGTAAPPPPGDAERPRIVRVEELPAGGLRLSWSWWRWSYVFLIFFTIAWDGFLVFWYAMAIFGHEKTGSAFSWFAILFPICHVAVGVGLTYFLIAASCNRTTIELGRETLRVRHAPVPWIGNRDIARERIHRLKIARTESQSSGRVSVTHGLLAELDPDGQATLVRSFHDAEHARFVGRTLAAALAVPLAEG